MIMVIQSKVRKRRKFTVLKRRILDDVFYKYYSASLTKAIMTKKHKLEQKFKNIDPDVKEAVINRYFTYCVEQNKAQFDAWRVAVSKLEYKYKIGLKIRLSIMK